MLFTFEDNTYSGTFYRLVQDEYGGYDYKQAFCFWDKASFFRGLYGLFPHLKADDRGCQYAFDDCFDDFVRIDIHIGLENDEEPIDTLVGKSFLKCVGYVEIWPDTVDSDGEMRKAA